jgi:hypothetical protein
MIVYVAVQYNTENSELEVVCFKDEHSNFFMLYAKDDFLSSNLAKIDHRQKKYPLKRDTNQCIIDQFLVYYSSFNIESIKLCFHDTAKIIPSLFGKDI